MSCSVCAFVKKLILNWLLLLDLAVNTVLLGSPKETVSARLGRAERAGNKAAHLVCVVLGWVAPNHCAWASDPSSGTVATEFWDWNPKTV